MKMARLLLLIVCTSVMSCAQNSQALDVVMLMYDEQEAGTDVYPVRVLVSKNFLRIDDGNDGGDFILLNRSTHMLHSVNHEGRNILVVKAGVPNTKRPRSPALSQTEEVDAGAPSIEGKQPVSRSYLADGQACLQVVAVPGLLESAVSALAEYARLLAAWQQNSLADVPAHMQTPCYLARYIHAPDWHLENGLPIQEWDDAGYRRSLVDFTEASTVSIDLFSLPADYERFSLD